MSLLPSIHHEFSPVFRLLEEYDRATHHLTKGNFGSLKTFNPKFDVKETPQAYEVSGEIAGIEQKDINIEWADSNTLTVSGRSEHRSERGSRPQDPKEAKGEELHQPSVEDETNTSKSESTTVATKAKNEVAKPEPETKYWVTERSIGEFSRNFSFPTRVDQDNVKASLKNGVLSITVPKTTNSPSKKIAIESSE